MLGDRAGQDVRRVRDDDAAARAGVEVDVVVADGEVGDDLQLRPGAVEERVVDPVAEVREEAVGAGRVLAELDLQPGRLEDLDRRRRRRVGDDDLQRSNEVPGSSRRAKAQTRRAEPSTSDSCAVSTGVWT